MKKVPEKNYGKLRKKQNEIIKINKVRVKITYKKIYIKLTKELQYILIRR